MSIKKLDDGRYEVDLRPRGSAGRRIRRKFGRKAEAIAFERYALANAAQNEWAGKRVDRRTLTELLDTWWLYHGQTQKNGEIEKRHLLKTIALIGNLPVNRLTKLTIMDHRSARLRAGISAATINRDIYRFSGMLSALARLGEFTSTNPMQGLAPLAQKTRE